MATSQQRGLRRRIADWLINTGLGRFTIWLAIILFAIGLDIYLYIRYPKMVGPEVFTGVLIAVVTIAPFLYRRIAGVPILSIEVPREDVVKKPIFPALNPPLLCTCPTQQTQQQAPIQEIGYLRLRVRNTGLVAARDCVFQVRIARWPSNCPANCHAPSDEYADWQDVTWAGWEPSVLIRPNDVRYANIIMMPLQNARACLPAQWHCANQCNPIIAWIAKRDVFMLGCTARLQDGLVPSEYVIDAQVTCRNGQETLEGLRLRVDQNWNVTDITTA